MPRNSSNNSKQADEGPVALAQRIQAIVALSPAMLDADALRTLLGGPMVLRTQQQVAEVFGQSTNTVQRSWRSNGMPGRSGEWNVVEILVWYLQRSTKLANRGPASNTKTELETIKLESERALLEIRQVKAQRARGQYVPLPIVQSILGACGNRVRDAFEGLPDKYQTRWPAKYVTDWTADMRNDIRAILTAISETPLAEMQLYVEQYEQNNT